MYNGNKQKYEKLFMHSFIQQIPPEHFYVSVLWSTMRQNTKCMLHGFQDPKELTVRTRDRANKCTNKH